MMQNLETTSALFWLLGAVAGIAAIYYSFGVARDWLGRWHRAAIASIGGGVATGSSLDVHIAAQWTEGRVRLDSLLKLIKKLGVSLETELETLRRLEQSDPRYEREARNTITPVLRRYTLDKHLRDECHALVPLLEFCAQDIAESQGRDMTHQLSALAEIHVAIKSVDRN
jgi:hypothetical protein